MAKFTIDTLPLHALHSYSASLLGIWYGLEVTDEELEEIREARPMGKYYVIVEVHDDAGSGDDDSGDETGDDSADDEAGDDSSDDETSDDTASDDAANNGGGERLVQITRRVVRVTEPVRVVEPMVRVAEIKDTIAEARGKVATHAPFARVATVRHDAAEHHAWPGSESDISVGDKLPTALFDWTR